MACYWTNFAWSGDPNDGGGRPSQACRGPLADGAALPVWPVFGADRKEVVFNVTTEKGSGADAVRVFVQSSKLISQCTALGLL
jgi:hypothetical protein